MEERRFSGSSESGDGSDVLETEDLFVSISSYSNYTVLIVAINETSGCLCVPV